MLVCMAGGGLCIALAGLDAELKLENREVEFGQRRCGFKGVTIGE
jgi:hypothetical protein